MSFSPFETSRAYVQTLNLKNSNDWKSYCKQGKLPSDIPIYPERFYKNQGWQGWGDWLGTGNVASFRKKIRPFFEARDLARSLFLPTIKKWKEYCKSNMKPDDIPASPHMTYRGKGWEGYGDWLGTNNVAAYNKVYLPYAEAKAYVHKLQLGNISEWNKYKNSGSTPDKIPAVPEIVYRDKGWFNYGDWLGAGIVATFNRKYLPYEEARKLVRSFQFKSISGWELFCKSEEFPHYLPKSPRTVYKGKGWVNWNDWLGTKTIAPYKRRYFSFEEARGIAQALGLKNIEEWSAYCKSVEKPIKQGVGKIGLIGLAHQILPHIEENFYRLKMLKNSLKNYF